MAQRERNRPGDDSQDQDPGDGAESAEALDAVRGRTADLVAASRAVVDQTMSANSEQYVNRRVQEGGQ
jgi:hypothetical protein